MKASEIYTAWVRTHQALTRFAETAIEYGLAELDVIEGDLLVLDAGTFLLLFGVLEQNLRALAIARTADEKAKAHFRSRQCKLDRLIRFIGLSKEIAKSMRDMEDIRNDAAHGGDLAKSYELPTLFRHIEQIEGQIAQAAAATPTIPAPEDQTG